MLLGDVEIELVMLSGKGLAAIHEQIKKWIERYAAGDPAKFIHKVLIMTGKNDSIYKKVDGAHVAQGGVSDHDASVAQWLGQLIKQLPLRPHHRTRQG